MLLLASLIALFSASTVLAQSQAQIQSCSNSIVMTSYPASGEYDYSTTDTAYFTAVYTYNPTFCTSAVRINRMELQDMTTRTYYACQVTQFSGTGTLTSVCNLPASPMTHGRMAILSARDGSLDWAFTINLGQRPTIINVENQFGVVGSGPIPSNESMRKRRSWRQALKIDFDCPVGQSMCSTGSKGKFECVDVSSDVMSCGACPGAMSVNDCTAIEGANEVECRAGSCHVVSCERGWTVGARFADCVPDFISASRTVFSW